MAGNVVIHFVNVTSTGRALLGCCVWVAVIAAEVDGAVGGRDPALSHAAPRTHRPRIIKYRIAYSFENGTGNLLGFDIPSYLETREPGENLLTRAETEQNAASGTQ